MFLASLLLDHFDSSQLFFNLITGLTLYLFIAYLVPTIKRLIYLPAGPWGLPLVGYLPFIEKHAEYEDLDRLATKYGPVYSLTLGQENVIVVSDWKHAQQVLNSDDLLDRPTILQNNSEGSSFIEMSGDPWRFHRRLSMNIFRDLGSDKSSFEVKIKTEIDRFLPLLEKGPILEIERTFLSTISNNLCVLLFGHSLTDQDPIKHALLDSLIITGKFSSPFDIFSKGLSPLVERFLPKPVKPEISDDFVEKIDSLSVYIQNEIDHHKKRRSKTFDNYIDGFLIELRKRKDDEDDISIDEQTLRQNIAALYGAGSQTVAATLSWAILYLVKYPEYYCKIRSEIGQFIGFDRLPDYSDRVKMPFTEAFIYEVYRTSSIISTNLFRRASCDMKIGKHFIPQDACIIVNFWTINHDPFLWISPNEFDPNRFLAEHGTKAPKPPFLTPFSLGKRSCPGADLADVQIFLYLTSIIQRYRIECESESEISLEPEYGTIRRPKSIPPLIFIKI